MTAVTMAVWAHSSAGDFAAIKGSQTSLTATDLVNMLPDIYQNIER
jgi:NAD(P)H-hydrate repair Nnr-like enzyme with NAD(P)H-hydrate dehydratase domain